MFSLTDDHQPSSKWLQKDNQGDKATSPDLKEFISEIKPHNSSPRTVLDSLEGQSNSTEDDTFSTMVSSITDTPSLDPKNKSRSKLRTPQSPLRRIASFLGSPFRRRSNSISRNEKRQPLLKCFSYEQISNATNDFHQGI